MNQFTPITQLPNSVFNALGWDYFISDEAADYLTSELAVISDPEREAFYEAGNKLYDMFVHAAEYVLYNNKLDTLGIPANLHEMIRITWERDGNLHLYGRFDFAGGVDGLPIKLIEFNADTPTSLPETAIIQWAQLKANNIDESRQFNFVYDALIENFERLIAMNPRKHPSILFSTLRDAPEDDNNVHVMMRAAEEAGFEVHFCYMDEVTFSDVEGIYAPNTNGTFTRCDFWFKLTPWEYIAQDEPELCQILTEIVRKDLTIILNPAYTMLFQSKGIMAHLWDLYPMHPLLLETSFTEPIGRTDYPYVQKVLFGREGANVTIHDEIGLIAERNDGDYEGQKSVYQEYTKLATDAQGYHYQAGVFYVYEACGLGFRRAKTRIIDNAAQFVGHVVQ